MLSLHDKPALTSNIFNAGFNALLIYQNMKKKSVQLLCLHDKPTLTPNIFNAGFNALLIYQNMLHEKEKGPMLCLHDKPTLLYTSSS